VDRDAIARAERRRQVTDELEQERDRAAALQEQRSRIVLELDGPGIDEEVFATMPPEDVELIRGALQGDPVVEPEVIEDEWPGAADEDGERWERELREENEAEIVRLGDEIAASNRRQGALQRYLDVLDGAPPRAASAAVLAIDELEAAWAEADAAPHGHGTVELICVRRAEGVHETPDRVDVTVERGVEGDRWADGTKPDPEAQVTLMNVRVARLIARDGVPLDMTGDNFLVDLDLAEDALPAGTRLRLGAVLLEVSTAPHTGCKKFRERFGLDALTWVNDHRDRRLRGMNCRVVEAGPVAVGDPVSVES
jgi:MOSC domain